MYHAELDMSEARRRVVLSTLGDTRPGDVFYLVSDPSLVFWHEGSSAGYAEVFVLLGDDIWRPLKHVGDGDPRQRVVIIHNTTIKEST